MGLRERAAAYAVAGAHVLVVEVPGWWRERVAVEQAMAARGWREALSPADADVLVVCGVPGHELAAAVDRTWDQLPGPRARVATRGGGVTADALLDEAATALLDDERQRADAVDRAAGPAEDMDHGDMDHGDMGHGDMDHGDMGHGDMDHGDMEMAPSGIALAGGGPDRDGLEMDVLHVPLGPVLAHWPAGLVLRCSLQGDVVVAVATDVLSAGAPPPEAHDDSVSPVARRCDAAARFLAVAGWGEASAQARRARDHALAGESAAASRLLARLRARVVRSWWLRWQLRGLGVLDETTLARRGLPDGAAGDVRDRLLAMLADAGEALDGASPPDRGESEAVTGCLADLVSGLDLAAVRLVVASLDVDTAALHEEVRRA